MIGHQDPSINFQSLILLTKSNTIHQNIPVYIPRKYIYPIDDCCRDEIDTIPIQKLILTAHYFNISTQSTV